MIEKKYIKQLNSIILNDNELFDIIENISSYFGNEPFEVLYKVSQLDNAPEMLKEFFILLELELAYNNLLRNKKIKENFSFKKRKYEVSKKIGTLCLNELLIIMCDYYQKHKGGSNKGFSNLYAYVENQYQILSKIYTDKECVIKIAKDIVENGKIPTFKNGVLKLNTFNLSRTVRTWINKIKKQGHICKKEKFIPTKLLGLVKIVKKIK